jgi:hypothetical protein
MSKQIMDQSKQSAKLQNQLGFFEKKEKQAYEALAALVGFIKDGKKQPCLNIHDFNKFKKCVLASIADLKLCNKPKSAQQEPKFNVKHYERAILCASDVTYRDMAIQAANKDLTKEAMHDLVMALRKNCCQASRQIKETISEIRKSYAEARDMPQLWHNIVEPLNS